MWIQWITRPRGSDGHTNKDCKAHFYGHFDAYGHADSHVYPGAQQYADAVATHCYASCPDSYLYARTAHLHAGSDRYAYARAGHQYTQANQEANQEADQEANDTTSTHQYPKAAVHVPTGRRARVAKLQHDGYQSLAQEQKRYRIPRASHLHSVGNLVPYLSSRSRTRWRD